ncbi:MAG: EamA family transporter [Acidimicrobiia bacterium]
MAWALVAALGFGFTQLVNRKANLLVDAYRTAFGLLLAVEMILLVRLLVTGEFRLLADAPLASLAYFSSSALIHYIGGWTFLALSQQTIGVARTGALVSSAPIVAALLAVPVLGEPLTALTLTGVLLSVGGLVLISLSQPDGSYGWSRPWFALMVALCWGIGPMLIRKGLEGLDEPMFGLTFGLAVALLFHGAGLAAVGRWQRPRPSAVAYRWMLVGGVTGSIAISAQWISFNVTTIAISFTVQQLAVLVVVGLAPIVFDARLERLSASLAAGTLATIAGSVVVVWAGA